MTFIIEFSRPSMSKWKIKKDNISDDIVVNFPDPRGCVVSRDPNHVFANAGGHEALPKRITVSGAEKLVEERLRALANAVALVQYVRERDEEKRVQEKARKAWETWRDGLIDGTSTFDDMPEEQQQAWFRIARGGW